MQSTLEQYKKTTAITNKQLNELVGVNPPTIEHAYASSAYGPEDRTTDS